LEHFSPPLKNYWRAVAKSIGENYGTGKVCWRHWRPHAYAGVEGLLKVVAEFLEGDAAAIKLTAMVAIVDAVIATGKSVTVTVSAP
jgi:hypothetical protein